MKKKSKILTEAEGQFSKEDVDGALKKLLQDGFIELVDGDAYQLTALGKQMALSLRSANESLDVEIEPSQLN